MKRKQTNYIKKVGLPPESLVYTGNRKPSPADIELMIYDSSTCEKRRTNSMAELAKVIDRDKVNLLIINNLTDITLIDKIGQFFHIQPMILEDVLNTSHLPKAEESGDQLVLTIKILDYPENGDLIQQHVSMILGDCYVIVFKDSENKLFGELKARIVNGKSRARQRKSDYLFYLLIDTLVDSYYSIVYEINNRVDKLEERLLENPRQNYIQDIYHIKQTMSEMRGVIYPVRESLLNIVQGDNSLLNDDTVIFMQDVKDHINHIIHMYESGRDTLSDLIDLNGSNINNRLNGSMNVLTIITTLFIPLTLIAGIYGMNFKFMPELSWKAGYPFAGLLMLITAAFMFYIIKRNKLL
jgi:magnesium transporter